MEHIISYFSQLSLIAKLIIGAVVLFVSLLQFATLSYKLKYYYKILFILAIQAGVYLFFHFFYSYSLPLHAGIFVLAGLLSIIFLLITSSQLRSETEKIDPIWSVKFPIRNSSPLIMQNIKRGIAIFGSAGSGKTESGFVPILKHAGERNIPCLCYDYKNGEITEIAHYFFQNSNVKQATIIPHSPMYSDRVNPFLPKYIPTEQHLRQQTKLIFANLKKVDNIRDSGSSFFDKIPGNPFISAGDTPPVASVASRTDCIVLCAVNRFDIRSPLRSLIDFAGESLGTAMPF